jgi:hypothetical protein
VLEQFGQRRKTPEKMTKMMAKRGKLCEAFHSVGPFFVYFLFCSFSRTGSSSLAKMLAAFSSFCAMVACSFFGYIRERKN